MINYGAVYPQAILVFVITLLYSVIQPLILIFGAVYFGIGYVVYKYKLLFGTLPRYQQDYWSYPHDIVVFSQSSISHTNLGVKLGPSPSIDSSGV